MIESNITNTDISALEPRLVDVLENGTADIDAAITSAYDLLFTFFINSQRKIKRVCKHLDLSTTAVQDETQRNRLVVTVSTFSSNGTITLYGSNDNSTFTTVTSQAFTAASTYKKKFYDLYDYYKIAQTNDGTASTVTSYLVETAFELAHIYLTLAILYREIISKYGSSYQEKADYYLGLYEKTLEDMTYSYDLDDDGEVTEEEIENNRVTFTR